MTAAEWARRVVRLAAWAYAVWILLTWTDTRAGRQMGNVPKAFSMVGLVNSALQLSTGPTTAAR